MTPALQRMLVRARLGAPPNVRMGLLRAYSNHTNGLTITDFHCIYGEGSTVYFGCDCGNLVVADCMVEQGTVMCCGKRARRLCDGEEAGQHERHVGQRQAHR